MRLENGEIGLSPAYDLISTKLMPINDPEEMALTVNGKKSKLRLKDFESLGLSLGMPQKAIENSLTRLTQSAGLVMQVSCPLRQRTSIGS